MRLDGKKKYMHGNQTRVQIALVSDLRISIVNLASWMPKVNQNPVNDNADMHIDSNVTISDDSVINVNQDNQPNDLTNKPTDEQVTINGSGQNLTCSPKSDDNISGSKQISMRKS